MGARSPHEPHRASTPLELLFDLVFVVAIAQAAGGLHHAIAERTPSKASFGYLMVFFAIWWAWMNFTWFASAYDCDDVPYRLAVFVQIAGALILAAGVPAMFETRAPNMAVVTGYVVMRLAMVAQWLRAAASDPDHRVTARRYAAGIAIVQLAWVGMLWVPHLWAPGFIMLAAFELAVPVWAERAAPTTWHPHHIAERYGLLTLIVLGESILAATVADSIGSRLRGSSSRPSAAHRRRVADRVLDVVDVLRSPCARSADQPSARRSSGVTDTTSCLAPRRPSARAWPSASTRPRITRRSARSAPVLRWRFRSQSTWCACGFFTIGRSTARLDGSARSPRASSCSPRLRVTPCHSSA